MTRIGLIDVDDTRFPNLALMKISAYHKALGDEVVWVDPMFGKGFDKVYMSKVFTFTPDYDYPIEADEIERGGTGYDIHKALPSEIDRIQPDYSIYGINDTAYVFLTRGCPNKCKWCIVPIKEGGQVPYMDVEEVVQGRSQAVLMDNNILSLDYGLEQLKKIGDMKVKVDFNQGLDARLVTPEVAELLARIRWMRYIRFACDHSSQIPYLERAHDLLVKHGYKGEIFGYCLIQDFDESLSRLNAMRKHKWFIPFAQPYRDFRNPHHVVPQWQKDMARWVDMKAVFRTVEFKDYEPRKGFLCREYLKSTI